MLAKFILVKPVPPIFRSFEFQVIAIYPRIKKCISNPKKLYAMQENSVFFSLTLLSDHKQKHEVVEKICEHLDRDV